MSRTNEKNRLKGGRKAVEHSLARAVNLRGVMEQIELNQRVKCNKVDQTHIRTGE